MKLGLFGINIGHFATNPPAAVDVALTVEAAGWESVWTGEHYVLPDPATPDSPVRPDTPFLDPFVALATIAARTTTLKLVTGVTVLPLHASPMLAKKVVSLDRVSGGRFMLGVGVGYLTPEFAAFDVPLSTRGRRTDEVLDSLAALWTATDPITTLDGRTVPGVRAEPRPLEPTGPPVHMGGRAPAAYRRAVARGAGWYGYNLDVDAATQAIAALRTAQDSGERPASLGELEITVTPPRSIELEAGVIERYAALGVDRLVVWAGRELRDGPAAFDTYARRLAALATSAGRA